MTTLEGLPAWYAAQKKLAKAPALHPVQQAMIDEQAVQCGYCFNGMIIKSSELLSKTPRPTEAQIRTAMNGHLCRCGTYPRIMKAIQRASVAMAGGARDDSPRFSENRRRAGGRVQPARHAGRARAGPRHKAGPPDAKQIDTWLAIHADNTATVYIGFAELGQGASTALLQIAAEELDLDMSQIKTVRLDTNVTPNQGGTYSSASINRGGPQVRTAAAEARLALLKLASAKLNAPMDAAHRIERRRVRFG